MPARLVEANEDQGVADLHGNRVPVSTLLVPEARRGDWVLVHAGFAIERLDESEARETWAVLDDLRRSEESGDVTEG